MRQQRGAGAGVATEISVPLPLQGLFIEARTAEVSGMFASRLENMRSSGVSLEAVKSVCYGAADSTALRRIPFEFGGAMRYIEIRQGEVISGDARLERSAAPDASHAYISSQVLIADGAGEPFRFDGVRFIESEWVTETGLPPGDLDGVLVHQDRPYFWKSGGALEFYYGDVGAVQGNLTRFPLGRLGNITGEIVAMTSLTLDAMENLNDNLCIVTSTGQIVIYEGLDPGDATEWRLVGRVQAAPPLSKHGFTRVGGDVWMISTSGIVSILDTLRQGVLALVGNISRPITDDIQAAARAGGGSWQLHTARTGDAVILNHVPEGGVPQQWIYDTESKAWNTATYRAGFWHNMGRNTEFTTPQGVLGTLKEAQDASEPVTAVWRSGWFRLRRYSRISHLYPTIIASGPLEVTFTILVDHDETDLDRAQARQTVRMLPDNPADPQGRVSLNEVVGVDAVGSEYQIEVEITAPWFEIVSMRAGAF